VCYTSSMQQRSTYKHTEAICGCTGLLWRVLEGGGGGREGGRGPRITFYPWGPGTFFQAPPGCNWSKLQGATQLQQAAYAPPANNPRPNPPPGNATTAEESAGNVATANDSATHQASNNQRQSVIHTCMVSHPAPALRHVPWWFTGLQVFVTPTHS
jgi:hypothetical protein